jgi:ribosomal 50S subunit-associated protein YjgA (DUF615 family)
LPTATSSSSGTFSNVTASGSVREIAESLHKHVRFQAAKDLGKKGQELRDLDEATLRRLPLVAQAFTKAREQVERYRSALVRQRGEGRSLRGYVVVGVVLERMLGEEVRSERALKAARDRTA